MTKKRVKLIAWIVIVVLLMGTLAFLIRGQRATDFSESRHIARISKRVKKRYFGKGSEYTDFTVYPLYDQNDRFSYRCVVEFEPQGYVFVLVRNAALWLRACGEHGPYSRSEENEQWRRFRFGDGEENMFPADDGSRWLRGQDGIYDYLDAEIYWEADKNGALIYRKDSPYRVANIRDERRYLLQIEGGGYIPAVKRGNTYLNLVSMEEFEYTPEMSKAQNPFLYISFGRHSSGDL